MVAISSHMPRKEHTRFIRLSSPESVLFVFNRGNYGFLVFLPFCLHVESGARVLARVSENSADANLAGRSTPSAAFPVLSTANRATVPAGHAVKKRLCPISPFKIVRQQLYIEYGPA